MLYAYSARATGGLVFLALTTPLPGQDLAEVFAKVVPGVVTIRAAGARVTSDEPPRLAGGMRTGAGVLLEGDGTILTAAHVVEFADEVGVEFFDGSNRAAGVVATEPGADLALVRVHGGLPAGVAPCVLGDSSKVRIGNQVFAVGTPMGMGHTLTAGHVSARRRDEVFLGAMRSVEHLQTDAAINPGNSGGPLFDVRGEVVGIVCHIVASPAGSEGLGFAVASNAVRELLLDHPRVWLGFDALPLPAALARALNVPVDQAGLLVLRVAKSSPAYRAGLRAGSIPARIEGRDLLLGGDVVVAILGHPLATREEADAATRAVRNLAHGDTLKLSVLREGRVLELEAPIDEPAPDVRKDGPDETAQPWLSADAYPLDTCVVSGRALGESYPLSTCVSTGDALLPTTMAEVVHGTTLLLLGNRECLQDLDRRPAALIREVRAARSKAPTKGLGAASPRTPIVGFRGVRLSERKPVSSDPTIRNEE